MVWPKVLWAMSGKSKYHCAVYTRKSTEDGLEQEFNSLDAQREACEAYIVSQASLGWSLMPKNYDDGGISGGTMERPALQALLADIRKGKVDVVVVYKIDRLTRSLMDFARMVDVFDAQDVSFVSVTQQFNTTTSMGRLTLNVLLSFAQFEREVTAERIRDKIAASKKKGMWMGGLPPLGFDVQNKLLVVNEAEAKTVWQLYELYQDLKSVRRLKEAADKLGIITKQRVRSNQSTGGKPFMRGHLYQLLSNPLYVGNIAHKGQIYPGRHQAIIDRDIWDAVQQQLSDNTATRHSSSNTKNPSLLTGLIYDETGDRLSPSHANKKGQRYRYYISHRLIQTARKNNDGWRIPAKTLENAILNALQKLLSDEGKLFDLMGSKEISPELIRASSVKAKEFCCILSSTNRDEKRSLVLAIIKRITLSPGQIQIEVNSSKLVELLNNGTAPKVCEPITLDLQFTLRRRGVEAKLKIGNGAAEKAQPDPKLIGIIARGISWFEQLASGQAQTVREIAQHEKVDQGDVSRMIGFAFLAPDIVEAIIQGRQPIELTAQRLKRLQKLPSSWQEQRVALGFLS